MKYKELRKLDAKSLNQEFVKCKKESFNLRFQKGMGELKNFSRLKFVRKCVARIKTLMNE